MRIQRRVLPYALGLSLVASLAFAGLVAAAETTLTADLAGVTEGDNPGDPDGSGSAMIVIDPEAGSVCWELTVENIAAVAQSHIHAGAEGESGDVVVPLDVDGFEGSSEGCVEDQDADALQGIVDDQSSFYVNIHTADFPAGAIRGQLVGASEVPNTAMTPERGSPVAWLGFLLLGLGAVIAGRHIQATQRALIRLQPSAGPEEDPGPAGHVHDGPRLGHPVAARSSDGSSSATAETHAGAGRSSRRAAQRSDAFS